MAVTKYLTSHFTSFISRYQPKPLRVSPALRSQSRNHHPPTLSLRTLCPRLMSPHLAERKSGRKLPNLPNPQNLPSLPNPQRCPRPRSLRRCRRSKKEGRRKPRKRKRRPLLLNPPASQLLSPMQKTSWVKWINRKRRRWVWSNVSFNWSCSYFVEWLFVYFMKEYVQMDETSHSYCWMNCSVNSRVFIETCPSYRLLRMSWVCQRKKCQSRTTWRSLKSESRIKTRPRQNGSTR